MNPGLPTTGATACAIARARELRRLVGPTAWAVLEDLAADARPEGDRLVAHSNVRRLADNLGLSKDTTARSLRRLIGAGLITRVEKPRGLNGTFGRATYLLNGPAADLIRPPEPQDPPAAVAAPTAPSPGRRQSARGARTAEQVTLFEVDPAPERR